MPALRPFTALSIALVAVLAGCSIASKSVPKEFAGGDLYERKADPGTTSDGVQADKPAPPRTIMLPTNKRQDKGLVLTVKPKGLHVHAGSMLPVDMIVRNTTGAPITIPYNGGKHFDIVVFADPDQRKPVFVWSEGRYFTRTFEEPVLSAGAPLMRILEVPTTADKTVDKIMEDGDLTKPLTPGKYYLWGTHEGQPFLAHGPIEIFVEE